MTTATIEPTESPAVAKMEGAEWAERREKLSAYLAQHVWGRAREQGWLNSKGGLNAKGKKAALEFVIGFACAFGFDEQSREWNWASWTAFLSSARGVEDVVKKPTEGKAS
jgi:hypothetical protein